MVATINDMLSYYPLGQVSIASKAIISHFSHIWTAESQNCVFYLM